MFGGGKPELARRNPIASELSDMRPSLLPGLLAAAQRNADRGYGDVALFEVGQIFLGAGDKDQRIAAAAIRRGTAKPNGSGRHWLQRAVSVDAYDAKADAMTLLEAWAYRLADCISFQERHLIFIPGAPGHCNSDPRTSSAISVSFTHAHSKRWM